MSINDAYAAAFDGHTPARSIGQVSALPSGAQVEIELIAVVTPWQFGRHPIAAALLALTVHQSAYAAEIVRGGILSVDQGQLEAASALGLSRRRTLAHIIIPQAMRSIIPSAGNQLIGMLKGTSMVSVIAVGNLLYSAQTIYNRAFEATLEPVSDEWTAEVGQSDMTRSV